MSEFKPFKIPLRKAAIPIINPDSGFEVHALENGAAINPPKKATPQNIEPARVSAQTTQDTAESGKLRSANGVAAEQEAISNDASTDNSATKPVPSHYSPIICSLNQNHRPSHVAPSNEHTINTSQDTVFSRSSRVGWKPDINASTYIPAYLWAIQQSPAMDKFSQRVKSIDFKAYIRKFAGSRYLNPVSQIRPELQDVQVTVSRHPKNLTPDNYVEYFSECLKLEAFCHFSTLSSLVLFNTTLELIDAQSNLYTLKVPGLRDHTPNLELGDVVIVRQFFPFPQITQKGLEWLSENQKELNGSIAPGFNGIQIYAHVWGVSRAKETVVLRVDGFFPSSKSCNVSFTLSADSYTALWRATQKVNTGASWSPKPIADGSNCGLRDECSWFYHMLFPVNKQCATQRTLPKGLFDRKWNDSQLNYEQQKAIDSVISRNYGNVPFLISGVPGSGKTKTVVECALQLLRCTSDVTPHLLVCAPSNPAADTLAIRLSSHLNPHELFRLNGWNRTFAEVPSQLLPYTYTENEIFSLPDFQVMMEYKVVVTTCKDADMLVQARLTNEDLMKVAYETITTISPSVPMNVEKLLHWTALIVDEAAQATEPLVCVPMTVVSTPLLLNPKPEKKTSLPLFVMAGDEHQLGPRVYNSDTALSVSLFERLFSRPIYADHPLSRRNNGPYKKLTKSMLPMARPAFVNLTRNYRSHSAILAIPSVLFYSDTLIPSKVTPHPRGPVPTWPGWRGRRQWPILFNCNTSQDQVEDVLVHGPGTGVYNATEAKIALRYTQSLLSHSSTINYDAFSHRSDSSPPPKPISQREIAIITPFLAQVGHLRKLFRSHNLHDINIGPIEAFQGLETRFLIICTTRTRADQKFLETDQSRSLGLVGEKQRFNMAITRAKEGVIIIGNPNVLVGTGKDETWRAFLSFCARNGCWTVERDANQSTKSTSEYWFKTFGGREEGSRELNGGFDITNMTYMSRLERGLLHADSLAKMDEEHEIEHNGDSASDIKSRQRRLGSIREDEDSDAAMWTAGLAAEEVLRGALDDEYLG
ncbi:DEAD/DEAH box helicase [Emydomyces testavorans]|uniref:DEAD/DEAH box helicase n=1 Tax=Emydomyces testavorans TaxID=2070801 RepID=A0AAF0DK22_9EURO|nr:DEAD/DEAH box helicase [Emydomyces testavorans]